MTKRPAGALNRLVWREKRHEEPDTMIYYVRPSSGKFRKGRASSWHFSSKPPTYYFTNYFLAWGYAMRSGMKGASWLNK